jgi:hypothetical protein
MSLNRDLLLLPTNKPGLASEGVGSALPELPAVVGLLESWPVMFPKGPCECEAAQDKKASVECTGGVNRWRTLRVVLNVRTGEGVSIRRTDKGLFNSMQSQIYINGWLAQHNQLDNTQW